MNKIFTIPNIISFFRILLIPAFAVTYFIEVENQHIMWSVIILVVSGVSDVLDGFIARTFNMVSDLGKVLDPIADKLTQVVIILCLAIRNPSLFIMFGVLFIKELLTLIAATKIFAAGNKPVSAKWFGKLSSAMIFLTMFYAIMLDIFPTIPTIPLYVLNGVSVICMIIAMTGYFKVFLQYTKGEEVDNETLR